MSTLADFTESDQLVIQAVQKLAHDRVRQRLSQITEAVVEFDKNAHTHMVEQLHGLTGDTEFTLTTLLESMMNVVGAVLVPEVEIGKVVLDKAREIFVTGLSETVLDKEKIGANAVERLENAINTLTYEISNREGIATSILDKEVDDVVLDNFDQHLDAQHPEPHNDPAWIAWICDQMGFTDATRELVYEPIRQWLEYEFIGLLTTVRAELLLAHGEDSSVVHPQQWGLEAQHDERVQYETHQGLAREQAWEDPYRLSP